MTYLNIKVLWFPKSKFYVVWSSQVFGALVHNELRRSRVKHHRRQHLLSLAQEGEMRLHLVSLHWLPSSQTERHSTWLTLKINPTRIRHTFRKVWPSNWTAEGSKRHPDRQAGRHTHIFLGLPCCAMLCRAVCCDVCSCGANGSTCVVC